MGGDGWTEGGRVTVSMRGYGGDRKAGQCLHGGEMKGQEGSAYHEGGRGSASLSGGGRGGGGAITDLGIAFTG